MNKEFAFNNGYYFECTDYDTFGDLACGEVLAWHHCSDKPMRLTGGQFRKHKPFCPNCKEHVTMWKEMHRSTEYTWKGEVSGLRFNNICRVIIDTEFSTVNIHTYISSNTLIEGSDRFVKLPEHDDYICYSINVMNGHTYEYSLQRHSKSSLKKQKYRRRNISLSPDWTIDICLDRYGITDDMLSFIRNEIQKRIKLFHFAQAPDFEEYGTALTFDNLVRYARCPHICPELYGNILARSRPYRYIAEGILKMANIPKELIVKKDCRSPIEQIIMQSRIPNVKSLRRVVFEYPEGISLLASISRNFQNIDIIHSLYDAYIDCNGEHGDCYVDFSADVFKEMVSHKGEQVTASKLLSLTRRTTDENAYTTLNDMIEAYDRLKNCGFDFAGSYDIDELHLYLASAVVRQESENRQISYTARELSLETESGGYSLKVVKDTYELADMGASMHICVGMYGDGAVKKKYTIYVLRNTGSSVPIGCIEVHGGKIVQAKGKYNERLKDRELDYVRKWAETKRLKICTRDLQEQSALRIPA